MTEEEFDDLMLDWGADTASEDIHSVMWAHPSRGKILDSSTPRKDLIKWSFEYMRLDGLCVRQACGLLGKLIPKAEFPPIPDYYDGDLEVRVACLKVWGKKKGY